MFVFWIALLLGTIALAYWRGCREEMAAALLILALSIANPLTDLSVSHRPRTVDWIGMIEDLVVLGQLSYFAINKRLWWAIFAAGFQSLAIFIHAARLADVDIGKAAYAAAYNKYGYLVIAAILVGIWTRGRPRAARA